MKEKTKRETSLSRSNSVQNNREKRSMLCYYCNFITTYQMHIYSGGYSGSKTIKVTEGTEWSRVMTHCMPIAVLTGFLLYALDAVPRQY